MKTLYFDCFCGASGDMTVGALLDLGVPLDRIRTALDSLDVRGYEIRADKAIKKGLQATQFSVVLEETVDQPHRHLRDILDLLDNGDLPGPVRNASAETFRRIAEAEAQVHGTTIEKVHFHEVGAVDSIVDVVAAHVALHALGAPAVFASPLHVGAGTVQCAHGVLPVPAPATALLLRNVPCYGGAVEAELVTPTGAALLTQIAEKFGPLPKMRIESVGYGSGTRDLEDRPNVLRVLLGDSDSSLPATEQVTVIEANVDDMNPELLSPLMAQLLEIGALDAFLTPVLGKKGRPANRITVLCEDAKVSDIVSALFRGSTTFGVRLRTEQRFCMDREWKMARTQWGDVRVKVGRFRGETIRRTPEFEDCRALAERAGVPAISIYDAALAAAVREELFDA